MGREGPAGELDDELRVGDVVAGRYRLRRFVARGGMGEVFEALDERATLGGDARVALKLLRADLASDDEWRSRFKREVAIASEIDSPHVARVLRAGKTQGGRRWIAFAFLDGEPLEARLDRERVLPFAEVAWMAEHALLGLDAAHGRGIVHRDVKPANLFLLRSERRLCVLDFGVAKWTLGSRATTGLTSVAATLGTPMFMSPEQVANPAEVDARTDLYALGLVVFRALAGRLPFGGSDYPGRTVATPRGDAAALAAITGLTWPDALEGWLAHTIAPRRDDRFLSAGAALAAWNQAKKAMRTHRQTPVARDYVHEDTDMAPVVPEWTGAAPSERAAKSRLPSSAPRRR